MIVLHRLGHDDEPFHLNPDLFATSRRPRTPSSRLTTGEKIVVAESPDEVVGRIRVWRAGILSDALASRRPSPLHEV